MSGKCLLVDKEELMRGTDFRVREKQDPMSYEKDDGIDLLVMKSFSS